MVFHQEQDHLFSISEVVSLDNARVRWPKRSALLAAQDDFLVFRVFIHDVKIFL